MCAANADDTNVNTIRNKNVRTIKDYVEIGKVMLPYALLCANHVLNEFYNAFGVTGENYTEAYRNGNQNTENQESESLESGYAPRYRLKQELVQQVAERGEVLRQLVQEHVQIFGEELAIVGKKFHDVVHGIVQEVISNKVVFQGIRIAVFLGTPIGLIIWIILACYSSFSEQ